MTPIEPNITKLLSHTDQKDDENQIKEEKKSIISNLLVLWIVWLSVFCAYLSLEVLQSSLHPEYGLHTLAIAYACKVVSSLLGPFIVINLTTKWTMLAGFLCHTVFVLANFYPHPVLLLTAGFLVGMATGPLWICFGVYVTVFGVRYSELTNQSKTAVLSKFNGLLSTATPIGLIIGNFISSTVLKLVKFEPVSADALDAMSNTTDVMYYLSMTNATMASSTAPYLNTTSTPLYVYRCGPAYCPQQSQSLVTSSLLQPDWRNVYLLVSILGCFNLTGVILTCLFLDNLSRNQLSSGIKVNMDMTLLQHLRHYITAFFQWDFIILTPCVWYIYFNLAFITSSYSKAYISCEVGIGMIGYISLSRGLVGMLSSIGSGLAGQKIHRNVLFTGAMITAIVMYLILYAWESFSNTTIILFVVAFLAGLGNGTNMSQATAFLGDVFTDRKTEAFAYYHFTSGLALALMTVLFQYTCMIVQLCVIASCTLLSAICYIILVRKKSQLSIETTAEQTLEIKEADLMNNVSNKLTKSEPNSPQSISPQNNSPRLHMPLKYKIDLSEIERESMSASQMSLTAI